MKKSVVIKISGIDKELVGKVASEIKLLKPVEPYKGKGIKERGQYVLKKRRKKEIMLKANYKKSEQRVRKKLKKVNTDRFRLSVFKSSKNISAQIIDDKNHENFSIRNFSY